MTESRLKIALSIALLALLTACASTQQRGDEGVLQAAEMQAESDWSYPVTGTRIPRDLSPYDRSAYGKGAFHRNVFTREDLERTGLIDVGEALRRVDPGIR